MKTSRPGQWSSCGLAYMVTGLNLSQKLDVDRMMVEGLGPARVSRQGVHHVREADEFASVDKSCIQDVIADNVGMMVFCVQQSVCMASVMCLDLSATLGSDERQIEGGLVLDPVPGVYKGVVTIDGNSWYGTIMSELGIFVDRCASSPTVQGSHEKMGVDLPEGCGAMPIGDLLARDASMVMNIKDVYLSTVRGGPTILSTVIRKFISERKTARANGDEELAAAYKPSTTATFGATSSAYGALSSKACGEMSMYMSRYCLRRMIEITTWCGQTVIYGETDSISVHIGGKPDIACTSAALRVKSKIFERMKRDSVREGRR
ncbi:hypothetical protein DL770_005040 [Monosporascus sp. CRB-9-2]|nr:hypothetical protein DL770_005040 [Monosporascus sp. CRB-9-2]